MDTLRQLGKAFMDNFKAYENKASKETINAGPKME